MINFSSNQQYLISKTMRTSQSKHGVSKTYWLLRFKDDYTKRTAYFSYWNEEEPRDEQGELIKTDTPYSISGKVNIAQGGNYLVVEKIKKDKKTINKNNGINQEKQNKNNFIGHISMNDKVIDDE